MTQDKANAAESPKLWEPGVGACYGNGWRQMWKYFLELFLIGLVAFIIGLPSGIGRGTDSDVTAMVSFSVLGLIGFIYGILVGGPVEYGVSFAHLKASRSDELKIRDMFEAFRNYWNAVLANLLVGVIVLIGVMLLIIPGIIFACKLAFTPYLVVDRKMDVLEAVRESWKMTNGHAWTVFFICLLGIPISIAGFICFIVGIIPAVMWIRLALASLYHSVSLSAEAAG